MITVHSARPSDVTFLADNMREADVNECIALGSHPHDALLGGLGGVANVALDKDDIPVAMFGVYPVTEHSWSIWLLGTDEVYRRPVSLIKLSKLWLPLFFEMTGADSFHNCVSVDNEPAIKFLEYVGAEFSTQVFERGGERFIDFIIRRPH